jgi:Fur family transcriptional regulator, ferric uptake regulator
MPGILNMKTSSIEHAILELLGQNDSHLKAVDVYQYLHTRFSSVNPSTVYRALERLAHSGKISVSDMGVGAQVFEKVTDGMHHHLVCQSCGRVQTIEHALVGKFFAQVEGEYHFKVETNHLVLFGTCSECTHHAEKEDADDLKQRKNPRTNL